MKTCLAIAITTAFLTLVADPAFSADSYLCIAEKSVGFSFERTTKSWDAAKFKVAGRKYILKRKENVWTWNEFGESFDELETCDGVNRGGLINCQGAFDVHMNPNNLRYLLIYPIGYVYDGKGPEGSNTPHMEIGTCSPL